MPYLYCSIDYYSNYIYQNIFISQEYYDTIVEFEQEYDEDEYNYATCPLFDAIGDTYPHIYDELYNLAVQYVALSLADGTYNKIWRHWFEVEISEISFDSKEDDIKINQRTAPIQQFKDYLKVIQWKCPDGIVEHFLSYIDIKYECDRKCLRKLAEKHNIQYKLTYKEWEQKDLYRFYTFNQYKREFEELFKTKPSAESILQVGKELQEDWKERHQNGNEILSKRNLEDLVMLLNRYIKENHSSSPLIQYSMTMQQIFHNDTLIPTRYDDSVRAKSVPMGGQGGYKRRIKRK
jgi:hypothetical protein